MIDNSNILTEGAKLSFDEKLKFYSNKINRTTIISLVLNNTQRSLELITPDGCWSWSIRALLPVAYAGGGTMNLILNSEEVELEIPANPGVSVLYEKKGEPYILAKDEIIIQNKLGVGVNANFYLSFERIMFNNE